MTSTKGPSNMEYWGWNAPYHL